MFLLCSHVEFSHFETVLRVHLFFAVLPPDTSAPAIAALGANLQRAHRLPGKRIDEDRLHATMAAVHDPLCPLASAIARAKWVGANIRHSPFPVCFEWSESFRHSGLHHPLVLRGDEGVRALSGFQRELCGQMRHAGFAVMRSFTPHVTLLWAPRCLEAYPIAPIHWTVRDFALVLSVVGESRHIRLGRWQLG
jgi:2'-5' RNA ligase